MVVLTLDGDPADLAFPTLAVVVRRISDHLRKHPDSEADDWPTKAKSVVDRLSESELRQLIGDLMSLREQFAQAVEQARLVGGLGWSPQRQLDIHDDAATFLAVLEQLVYERQHRRNRREGEDR